MRSRSASNSPQERRAIPAPASARSGVPGSLRGGGRRPSPRGHELRGRPSRSRNRRSTTWSVAANATKAATTRSATAISGHHPARVRPGSADGSGPPKRALERARVASRKRLASLEGSVEFVEQTRFGLPAGQEADHRLELGAHRMAQSFGRSLRQTTQLAAHSSTSDRSPSAPETRPGACPRLAPAFSRIRPASLRIEPGSPRADRPLPVRLGEQVVEAPELLAIERPRRGVRFELRL